MIITFLLLLVEDKTRFEREREDRTPTAKIEKSLTTAFHRHTHALFVALQIQITIPLMLVQACAFADAELRTEIGENVGFRKFFHEESKGNDRNSSVPFFDLQRFAITIGTVGRTFLRPIASADHFCFLTPDLDDEHQPVVDEFTRSSSFTSPRVQY